MACLSFIIFPLLIPKTCSSQNCSGKQRPWWSFFLEGRGWQEASQLFNCLFSSLSQIKFHLFLLQKQLGNENTHTHTYTLCTLMFSVVFLIPKGKQPKPSADKWINKMWYYPHNGILRSQNGMMCWYMLHMDEPCKHYAKSVTKVYFVWFQLREMSRKGLSTEMERRLKLPRASGVRGENRGCLLLGSLGGDKKYSVGNSGASYTTMNILKNI